MKTKFSGILTLLLAFVVQFTFAQEKTISGTVSDENGLPLPTATVIIQGTTTGASTDFDGNYTINANQGDVLIFSYVGYANQTQAVGASNKIDASLQPDNTLDEVVVTAFGIKREKRETVYQTEAVKADELLKVQPQSAASALAGKVAGLQINVQDNGVNPGTLINLRGLRSITQSNGALVVIDGSISDQATFGQINPNDIESINVLKGATAAALYGSLAANGALIVSTKRGKKGDKFTVGINSTYTMQQVAYMPDFQDEYGNGWQGAYEAIENTNWGPAFDGQVRRIGPVFSDGSYQAVPYAVVEDNIEDFYNTGGSSQNTAYFSGSDEKNNFYVSLGKVDTDGIVSGDEYNRTTFRVNASRKMGKLELGVNTSFINDKTSVVGSSIGAQDRPLYWFLLNTPNNIPLTNYSDWQNDFYASPDGFANGYYENPYWAIDTNRDNSKSNRLLGNVHGSLEATDWLNLTARFGVNIFNRTGREWRDAQSYSSGTRIVDDSRPSATTSFVRDDEYQSKIYTTDFIAETNFDLTDDISLKFIAGANNTTREFRESAYRANNLSIPGFYNLSNTTGAIVGDLSSNRGPVDSAKERTYGVFGDATIGYKNWLYLNASGRNDWTSTLAEDQNSYFYPGFGLSFVFSELVEADFLNYGKLTFNNSTVYNDLNPYQIAETFSSQVGFPYASTGINGYVLDGTAVDGTIKKEKISSTEFGLETAFLDNRISLTAAYYNTKTTDLITLTTSAPSAGSSNFLTNIAGIDGSGFELSLGLKPFKSQDGFNWTINANYTAAKQVVDAISPGVTQLDLGNNIFAVVGMDFPQINAPSYERDPQGRIVIDASTGNPIVGGLKTLGKTTPDYIVGLTNIFDYKGFTFTTTLDYRTGHVYYSQLADSMEFTGRSQESVSSNRQDFIYPNSVINTGTAANPVYVENTNIQTTGGLQNFWTNTYNDIKENYVRDATALKIREVSLTYDLPNKFIDKTFISKVSLGIIARNLVTWLPEENRFSDPEFNNSSERASGNAIGASGYFQSPPTRSFGVNVNLEF